MPSPEIDITITQSDALKCDRCWKVHPNNRPLKHLGVLCNRCYLVIEELFVKHQLDGFLADNHLTHEQVAEDFPYLQHK